MGLAVAHGRGDPTCWAPSVQAAQSATACGRPAQCAARGPFARHDGEMHPGVCNGAHPEPVDRRPPMPPTTSPADSPTGTPGRFDATDPVVLGANPLVGLNRRQVAAALGRLLQRVAVEPGVVTATTLGSLSQLVEVLVGRSDVAPEPRDKRFTHPAWSDNPVYRRLVQAYLVEARAHPRHRRRRRARPEEPRAGPLRGLAAHRGAGADQHPARQPQRAGQGGPDPGSQRAHRSAPHGP